ncbi:MAG: ATP-binding protein, partial [Acidobacteriia bacterium]|nr:ATP-binding protein [Terriglobia bacterium]
TTKRLLQELPEPTATRFTVADQETLHHIPIRPLHSAKPVAVRLKDFETAGQLHFVLNQPVTIEETRHFEFKEITGGNPVHSIVNTADEYAVAFLNSEGGRIYWGIRDKDRIAVGVRLSYADRDKVRRDVTAKLNEIDPHIDPSQYRIEIHGIRDELGSKIPDLCIVELVVPEPKLPGPYYTGGGDAWVKVDGNKQKLRGSALTAYIKNKFAL